ncbi:MAG TPA: winged helix-turn-helix domain-containing protein [Bryobacteraceae bacterium]|jgi:serine/threonine-protein kinase|nr:winged helix-turn-helix domain-containing protein [Bryobacteraceae bacterium]
MLGNSRPIHFGVFEVDRHTGELRKQGLRIKLRDQPFQILLLLLARPGEVISRDELQKQLWPADTFVDFDRGLNKAVNHLRDALGDSAESPRFIETLPKRGYRFIASVDAGLSNGHPVKPIVEMQKALAEQPDRGALAQPLGGRGGTRGLKLKRSAMLPWMVVGASLATVGISGALLWRATRPPDRPLIRFSVDLGPEAIQGRAESGEFFRPIISPDGTRLVFPAKAEDGRERLAVRRLDQSTATMLAGTEGAVDPFISPDGQWIGFFAGQKLKKIPLLGGVVVSLCNTSGLERGASWAEDGAIIANLDNSHLFRVPATGGEPQLIGKPEEHGERTWRWPQVLPGGKNVLFTGFVAASAAAADSANIEVLSLKSGRVKVVRRGGSFARYLPSGHLIYFRQGTLYGEPFDPERLETRGPPVPLLEDLADSESATLGLVSFSGTGILLYARTARPVGAAPLVWLDSTGKSQSVVSPSMNLSRQAETPRLSPDGSRLALAVAGDLSVHDLQRGTVTRLTFDGAMNRQPTWTPDGQHLAYSSGALTGDGEFGLWWIRSDGSSQPQRLVGERTPLQVSSISPDGRTVAFVRTGKDRSFEIWTLPLDLSDPDHPKTGKPEPFASESLSQVDPAFSPDGRWIAYVSTNGAGLGGQISVRPFPSGPSAGRWPVSESGAKFPVWSRNRKELFYLNSDNHIMVARYTANEHSFVPEKSRQWSPAPLFRPMNNGLWNLDVAPDGRRFVVLTPPESKSQEPATVHATILLNFFDELRRRLPSI